MNITDAQGRVWKVSYDSAGNETARTQVGGTDYGIGDNAVGAGGAPLPTAPPPSNTPPQSPSGGDVPMPTPVDDVEEVDVPRPDWETDFGMDPTITSTEDDRNIDAADLNNYQPPSGENVTPLQVANYNLSYVKDALRSSQAQNEEMRQGALAGQEEQSTKFREQDQQTRAEDLKGRTKINPEYTKLSAQEKAMNMLDVDKDGNVTQREEGRISETISDDSGRDPINTGEVDTKAQYLAAHAEMAANAQAKFEAKSTINATAMTKQKNVARTNKEIQEAATNSDIAESEGIKADIANLEVFLGVTEDQTLQVNADGSVKIIDNKTGKEYDPVKEAEEEVEEERQKALKADRDVYQAKKDSIIARHTNQNGTLTIQGKQQIADLEDDHLYDVEQIEDSAADMLESAILSAKKNKLTIDAMARKKPSVEEIEAKKVQKEKEELMNGIIDQSRGADGLPTITPVEAQKLAAKMYDAWGEDGVSKYQLFNNQLDRENLGDAFTDAMNLTGDANTAASFMKKAGIPQGVVDQQKMDFYRGLGYSDEEIGVKVKADKVSDIVGKFFLGEDVSVEEMEMVRDFQSDHKWESRKIELLKTTELSGPEIFSQIEQEKAAATKAKADAKKRSTAVALDIDKKSIYADTYDLLIGEVLPASVGAVTEFIADNYNITKTRAEVMAKDILVKDYNGKYQRPDRDDQLRTTIKRVAGEQTDNIADRVKWQQEQFDILEGGGYFEDGMWISPEPAFVPQSATYGGGFSAQNYGAPIQTNSSSVPTPAVAPVARPRKKTTDSTISGIDDAEALAEIEKLFNE